MQTGGTNAIKNNEAFVIIFHGTVKSIIGEDFMTDFIIISVNPYLFVLLLIVLVIKE